jgi:hypothetical protein
VRSPNDPGYGYWAAAIELIDNENRNAALPAMMRSPFPEIEFLPVAEATMMFTLTREAAQTMDNLGDFNPRRGAVCSTPYLTTIVDPISILPISGRGQVLRESLGSRQLRRGSCVPAAVVIQRSACRTRRRGGPNPARVSKGSTRFRRVKFFKIRRPKKTGIPGHIGCHVAGQVAHRISAALSRHMAYRGSMDNTTLAGRFSSAWKTDCGLP